MTAKSNAFKRGDFVVLKKRPKGFDVPGRVDRVEGSKVYVEIRPGKVVEGNAANYEKVSP